MQTSTTVLPSPALSDYVSQYLLRTEHLGRQTVVRPITASPNVLLIFHLNAPTEAFEYSTGKTRVLPAAMVVGPQSGRRAELLVRGDRAQLVVLFRPGGFHRLFHVAMERLAETAVDACDVIGPDAGLLGQRLASLPPDRRIPLLQTFLEGRATVAKPRHPSTEGAAAILQTHGTRRVADLIRASGLSSRQFERSFREYMGISPKMFARTARLEFALRLKRVDPSRTWTQISQEAGFFDQTHFVKDFKALVGETPSTFPLTDRRAPALAVRRPA